MATNCNIKDKDTQNVINQINDLHKEYKNLHKISQENLDSISVLTSFFESFKERKETDCNETEEKMKSIINPEKVTNSNNTILITNVGTIYQTFNDCVGKARKLTSRFQSELIEPLKSFRESLKIVYTDQLKKLSLLISKFTKSQCFFQSSRNEYYKYNYEVYKISKLDLKGEIFAGDTEESKVKQMIFTRIKGLSKNSEQIYKYELEKYNKDITEINNDYNKLLVNMQQNEESRTFYIKSSMDKFKGYVEEYNKLNTFIINEITRLISSDVCSQDIKDSLLRISKNLLEIHDDKDKNVEKIRFQKEKYISYNDYLAKVDNNVDENMFKIEYLSNELLDKYALDDKGQNEVINNALDKLFKEEEIPMEEMAVILDNMKNPKLENFMKKFLDALLDKRKSGVKFVNLKNLKHLANIICYISLTHPSINSGNFELNFKIIYVAERIFYQNSKDNYKVYLCALLSLNNYYRTRFFWRDIIELKLANKLSDHIKRIRRVKLEEEKKPSLISKIGNKLGFTNEIKKKSLIFNSRIKNYIKNIDLIELSKIDLIDKIASTEMTGIIKECIPNLANFNFPSEEALDMIAELSEHYRIPKENINYYVSYYNVSCCTLRKALPNEMNTNSDRSKRFQNIPKNADFTYKIMGYSLKYLDYKDYLSMLLLSHKSYDRLSKKIYNIILKNPKVTKDIRLNIWKNILKTKEVVKEYNYHEILKEIATHEPVKRDEIQMDVLRTYVGDIENIEEKKGKITNILRAISVSNGEIKYCQGMNYIAEFILEYTGNEEEAFYIFLSFFKHTEYPLIFEKDLKKLKIFFYVFKRIISLFEPELYSYFNSNSVDVHFFMPPWFITLFLSSRQYIKQDHLPIVLIRIIDSFLISGWKSLMKVGINVLHCFEDQLMTKKYEEMLQFLINDLLKYDFFHDEHLDKIEKCFTETRIKKKLIKNIENEFRQEESLGQSEGH